MSDGTNFAIALILFWIAGLCMFVAFHPGGIQVGGRQARNPADVLRYLMGLASKGAGQSTSADNAPGTGDTTGTQTETA